MDTIIDELPKFISAVVIAVITAIVAVHLSLRRYRSEQWWSRKADSYAAIFSALHDMKIFLSKSLEDQIGNAAQPPDEMDKLAQRWVQGSESLDRAIDMGIFLFSPSAVAELEKLQGGLQRESVNDFSWDNIPNRLDIIEECLHSVRILALKDLGIN